MAEWRPGVLHWHQEWRRSLRSELLVLRRIALTWSVECEELLSATKRLLSSLWLLSILCRTVATSPFEHSCLLASHRTCPACSTMSRVFPMEASHDPIPWSCGNGHVCNQFKNVRSSNQFNCEAAINSTFLLTISAVQWLWLATWQTFASLDLLQVASNLESWSTDWRSQESPSRCACLAIPNQACLGIPPSFLS